MTIDVSARQQSKVHSQNLKTIRIFTITYNMNYNGQEHKLLQQTIYLTNNVINKKPNRKLKIYHSK